MNELLSIISSNQEDFIEISNFEELANKLQTMSNEEQMRYILENLTKGPGKCEFTDSMPYEHQIEVDAFPVSEKDQGDISFSLKTLQDFLAAPIVNDGFGNDHGDITERTGRRGWRDRMQEAFGPIFDQVYGNNKLRGNYINHVTMAIYLLEDVAYSTHEHQSFFEPVLQPLTHLKQVISQEMPDGTVLAAATPGERKIILNKVDQALRDVLDTYYRLAETQKQTAATP
jgi:hypothetical protein